MINVGFTGTRKGMTPSQKHIVAQQIAQYGAIYAHHGDCVGADAEFHDIVRANADSRIIGHVPALDVFRAHCAFDATRVRKSYLMRNRDIVDESDVMIAAPYENRERQIGGTWATIRYAIKQKKRLIIVYRNGTMETMNWETP